MAVYIYMQLTCFANADEREAGAMGLEDDGTRLSDYLYNTEYGKDIRDWETQYAPSVVHEQ